MLSLIESYLTNRYRYVVRLQYRTVVSCSKRARGKCQITYDTSNASFCVTQFSPMMCSLTHGKIENRPLHTHNLIMSSLKSLPPHVARELRRHISPKPLLKPGVLLKELYEERKSSVRSVLVGCVVFTAAAASLPLAAHYWVGGLNDKDEPLTAPQVRRGAFQNSGTRDVGRDPNWDFNTGQYKKATGYSAMYENEKRLPGEYLAMPANDLKKHEEKLEAFAKGAGKNN